MTIGIRLSQTPHHLIPLRDQLKATRDKFLAFESLQLACINAGWLDLSAQAGRIARRLEASLPALCAEYELALQDHWFDEQEELLLRRQADERSIRS